MKQVYSLLMVVAVAATMVGCQQAKVDRSLLIAHRPRTIVVVPPLNNTADVSASEAFLSTVTRPLAEQGYYVHPVVLVNEMFKANGVPTPQEMHQVPLKKVGEVFHADAVLYPVIRTWTTTYIVIDSSTTVTIDYRLVDVDTGKQLWTKAQTYTYSSGNAGGGLAGMMASALAHSLTDAMVNHKIDVARTTNQLAFRDERDGLILGPYRPDLEAEKKTQ